MARTDLAYPYHLDASGRTATAPYGRHVRDLIEQVLFTTPGERCNRPDFGCGVDRLVFHGMTAEMLATTRHLVQAELQRWLAGIIDVHVVELRTVEGQLTIKVAYVVIASQERRLEEFRA
jgi:phage baseplate assembly protein W